MKPSLLVRFAALVTLSGSHINLTAQQHRSGCVSEVCASGGTRTQLSPHADEVAEILAIKPLVEEALAMRASRPAGAATTAVELSLRQEISETVLAASFDVDGVLAEPVEE